MKIRKMFSICFEKATSEELAALMSILDKKYMIQKTKDRYIYLYREVNPNETNSRES